MRERVTVMAKGNFVAYYRGSTPTQGVSGLGLEAQRTVVNDYLNGGRWKLVAEFTEVESGQAERTPGTGQSTLTLPDSQCDADYRQARSFSPEE